MTPRFGTVPAIPQMKGRFIVFGSEDGTIWMGKQKAHLVGWAEVGLI